MPIDTILLIPAEGSTLLEDPCAPLMLCGHCCGHRAHRRWETPDKFARHADCYMCAGPLRALVLATDGRVQPHGCLTLANGQTNHMRSFHYVHNAVQAALHGNRVDLLAFLAKHHPGALLIFLSDGVEVEP